MNFVGLYYFTRKEIHRVLKVINQSIFPPIVSSLIFIVIFSFILGKDSIVSGFSYLEFLVPGLVMMAVVNNSFMNSSFSLFISKFEHHFEYLLTMPMSYFEITSGYVLGSLARSLLTAIGILVALAFFIKINLHNVFIMLLFIVISSVLFGSLGVLVALWGKQFDHLGMFNTFLLTPLTMLGGVFYSIQTLPETFQVVTKFNPIFYLVDGFRYGMLGINDAPVWLSLIISLALAIGSFTLVVYLMKKGWRVKQ